MLTFEEIEAMFPKPEGLLDLNGAFAVRVPDTAEAIEAAESALQSLEGYSYVRSGPLALAVPVQGPLGTTENPEPQPFTSYRGQQALEELPGQRRTNEAVMQDDIADLLRALGLGDHARPISPHRVLQEEILPAIRQLQTGRSPEEC